MPRSSSATLALFCCLQAACSDSRTIADAPVAEGPVVLSPNDVIGASVGTPIAYDAAKGGATFSDPSRGGLRYALTLSGSANGLTTIGAAIGGAPTAPGVIVATLTATDSRGNTAVDRFPVVVFAAGLKSPNLPATALPYSDAAAPLPVHFSAQVNGASVLGSDNATSTNPITDAGAALGRVLFYDPRLSSTDVTPCSSCHIQSLGFSDAIQFSVGFAGGQTGRHSPGLANARFYKSGRFFWDERAATLEEQVLGPIQNPVEMGMPLDTLVLKLRATSYYRALFAAAFGTPDITTDRVSRALAQFVRSLTSGRARYDRAFGAAGSVNFAGVLTEQEQQGEQHFTTAGCGQCHTTVAQVSDAAHNIGLDAVTVDVGTGRGAVKVPSLRNVAVRPRYMHDGRFATLEQVIDFFNAGVQPNPDLDPLLKAADGAPKRLGLSADQKAALVAFLKTLTDSTFLKDPRFSDPFIGVPIPPPPPSPGTAAITIQGNAYHPASLSIARGSIISFTNMDNRRHSASFFSSAIVSTPIFTSGTQFVTMPAVPGTYAFQCAVHGAAMSGTITVP